MRQLSGKATIAALVAMLALTSTSRAAETFVVQEQTVPDYKMVSAILTTRDMGEARARISGTLVELRVHEGDVVTKGQTLAVIADQKIALEVQARKAQASALQAERDRAAADLSRVRVVFDKGFYSKARLDQAVATATSADSAWKAAVASQAVVSEQAGQGKVLALAAGKVVRASVPAGAVVMAGDVVVVVASNDSVVRIEVPEREARELKQGDAVRLIGEGGAVDGRPIAARIREIYPEIRNGRVTADLDSKGVGSAFVGQRIRVMLAVGERRAIIVPQDFVTTRFGVDYVSLAGKSGALDIPVQRGQSLDVEGVSVGVEILSGLKPGDTLLRPDGKLVRL